ncbi:sodium:solute symporter family protein [Methylobacterium sp. J-088]|uniref:sodium:solute symporter family protein n=1 Tax=Methylobacterium sp. J-088 TaxID=2836664 RepID=UPI001FBA47FD|nr:sodium:solute symporter family protein [Methylobacterium sp. J-088]MCJ2063313.1 sodium:solute symporter family protein [Methylobacterium sp. J-088]
MEALKAQGTVLTVTVIMIVAYLALTTWLTYRYRAKTSADYMVAGRSVPAVVIGVLMMSEFIAPKSTIGVAQAAFESGMAASWAVASVALGFLLFGLGFAKKLYATGEYTISAAIAKKYGRSTQLTVSLIMIYALLLVLVAQYVSGAAVLASVFGLPLGGSSLLIAGISTAYCMIGGQKSTAYVSLMHTVLKIIGVAIVCVAALTMSGGVTPVMAALPPSYFTWDGSIGLTTIVAWTIASVGAIFSTQFIVQAISSLKGPQDVRGACAISAFLCLPVSLALGFIGVSAKFLFPEMKSLYAFPVFLNHLSPFLSGVVMVSIIASILVAVGTVVVGASALIVRDFYVPIWKPTAETELRVSRLLAIPIAFLPLLLVFFAPQVLHLSFFTRALRLAVTVVAVFAFYFPRFGSNRGATLGLLGAAVTTTGWYLMGDPFGIDDIYIALVTPAVVIALERLIRRDGGSIVTPEQVAAVPASVP